MNILVTGAHSDLGRHVVEVLGDRDEYALKFSDRGERPLWLAGKDWTEADLTQPDQVEQLLDGVDKVLHLEALALAAQPDMVPSEAVYRNTCGIYNLARAAQAAGVERLVLASSLDLFARLPVHWQVNEMWRPRPTPSLSDLCCWTAELSLRETIRAGSLLAVCLRFATVVDPATLGDQAYNPAWVSAADAVHGMERALLFDAARTKNATRPDWHVFHVAAPGPRSKIRVTHTTGDEERSISSVPPFSYAPQDGFQSRWPNAEPSPDRRVRWQDAVTEGEPIPDRPIRNVVIFGSSGPMGSATSRELADVYTVRQADLRSVAEALAAWFPGMGSRPQPVQLEAPHEFRRVDMGDTQQVVDACAGMDAIVNCSVLRPELHAAFKVNTVGAFNIALGAVAHDIRRVVQTGPFQQMDPGYGSYVWDYDIPVDAPCRPLDYLYHHTKYLGQEILRVFAEYHNLEVPVMLFWRLAALDEPHQIPPFAVTYEDSARSLRAALEVPSLPSPYEQFNISVDLPHRRFDLRKAKDLLGFEARDQLDRHWMD